MEKCRGARERISKNCLASRIASNFRSGGPSFALNPGSGKDGNKRGSTHCRSAENNAISTFSSMCFILSKLEVCVFDELKWHHLKNCVQEGGPARK